jgi:ApaG protein
MLETAVTNKVQVDVESFFVPEQSDKMLSRYFFSYRVKISNLGQEAVKLVSRKWLIVDGFGHQEKVQGPGVIGQQPRLAPGDSFEYESFCPLPTATGTMSGTYQMLQDNGQSFDVVIPEFFLIEPGAVH